MIRKLIWGVAIMGFFSGCSKIRVKNPTSEFRSPRKLIELEDKRLMEVSGLAASIKNPGYFWAHNDSGNDAQVFLIDESLNVVFSCRLDKVENRDWEDIAIGPGPEQGQPYIYIGDIGDNQSKYDLKYIYRFEEPLYDGATKSVTITKFDTITFSLAGKVKDTETLLIDPVSKDLYVISKREDPVWVYLLAFPHSTRDTLVAESLFSIPFTQIVGGDISRDGKKILLKNYEHIYYWTSDEYKPAKELLKEKWFEVPYELEPQGEAIAWARDHSGFYTLSEKNVGKKTFFYLYATKKKRAAGSDNTDQKEP